MSNLEDQLKDAKRRFGIETAKALAGDDSAWHRAELHGHEVRRLLAQIKAQRPKPTGEWAIAQSVFKDER